MTKNKSVLIVSSHADDHVMAAGTLAKLKKKGFSIYEVLLTDSSEGRDFRNTKDAEVSSLRDREYDAAVETLGIDEVFKLKLEDLSVVYNKEVLFQLVEIIRKVRPTVGIMHHHFDWHPDHKNASVLSQEAFKIAGTTIRTEIGEIWRTPVTLFMEGMIPIKPDVVVDITDTANIKREVWNSYASQAKPELVEYFEGLMKVRGYQLHKEGEVRYAEAFSTDSSAPVILFDEL